MNNLFVGIVDLFSESGKLRVYRLRGLGRKGRTDKRHNREKSCALT